MPLWWCLLWLILSKLPHISKPKVNRNQGLSGRWNKCIEKWKILQHVLENSWQLSACDLEQMGDNIQKYQHGSLSVSLWWRICVECIGKAVCLKKRQLYLQIEVPQDCLKFSSLTLTTKELQLTATIIKVLCEYYPQNRWNSAASLVGL